MEIILYGDVYFLINFLFDTLLLYITARITNTPFKPWRLLLAAALASVYAVLSLFFASTLPLHLISAF
ncbi:MAG: sigma-E processing peptidase SpoIIGA, partial [Clostridia bacterium]|nr:sigma-E processing peptidase SpoIIGA [Clostridia bacterium]